MWTVYEAVNKENGKRYIGVTGRTLPQRKARHIYMASNGERACPRFYDALRKHGTRSFKWKSVATFAIKEFAYFHEHILVQTLKPEYNVAPGGAVGPVEAWNKKPVICLEDGLVYPSATHASKAYKIDNSEVSKACRGDNTRAGKRHFRYYNGPMSLVDRLGRIASDKDEAAKRRKRVPKGLRHKRKHKRGIETICLDDGRIFPGASAAASFYNSVPNAISVACKRGKSAVDRHFAYVRDVGQRMFA